MLINIIPVRAVCGDFPEEVVRRRPIRTDEDVTWFARGAIWEAPHRQLCSRLALQQHAAQELFSPVTKPASDYPACACQ